MSNSFLRQRPISNGMRRLIIPSYFIFAVIMISALFILSKSALATFNSSSTNFKASDQNVSDLGGNTTSTSFRLYQNAGQVSVGESSSTNFKVRAGVLYWDGEIISPTVTPTPSVVSVVSGGGGGGAGIVATPSPGTPGASISPGASPKSRATPVASIKPPITCDFNNDGFCNIVDLSILLYWYGKTGPQIARYDLNSDKKIDLKDISILFYHWKEE